MYLLPMLACLLAWAGLTRIETEAGRAVVKLAAVLGAISLVVVGIGGGH